MILIGCDYSKGNGHETNGIMTQQWNKCAHLTNNAKCIFCLNEKTGYATTWDAYSLFQMIMQPFLYEILTITLVSKPNASTMQVQNAKMHKYAKNNIFLYFQNKWDVKETKDSTTLRPCDHSQTTTKKGTKIK